MNAVKTLLVALICLGNGINAFASCDNLQKIVEVGPDFESVKGQLMADGSVRAEVVPPFGLARCEVLSASGIAGIICHSSPLPTQEIGTQLQASLAQQIEKCLGSTWTIRQQIISGVPAVNFRNSTGAIEVATLSLPAPPGQTKQPSFLTSIFFAGRLATATTVSPPIEGSTQSVDFPWKKDLTGFCTDLKEMILQSKSLFKNILGKKIDDETWQSTLPVRGTQTCEVNLGSANDPSDFFVDCHPFRSKDRSEIRRAYIAFTADVKACLGQPWKLTETSRSGGALLRSKFSVDGQLQSMVVSEKATLTGITLMINARD